mmetsp:Transcript_18488/g.37718  ORF Transcript_18488/g.37718 Transcript_18488/m.37718 type:complete len:398 (+) Transcript_18488:82-1275(+)
MGKKIISGTLFLLSMSMVVTFVSLFLPFHKFVVATAGFVHVFSMVTYVVRIHVQIKDTTMCSLLEAAGIEPDFCKIVTGSSDLEEVSSAFCQPFAQALVANACSGTHYAYTIGCTILIAAITTFMLDGLVVWMLYDYLFKAPKRKYRNLATNVLAVTLVVMALPLLIYVPMAIVQLDHIDFRINLATWLLGRSMAGGTSKGYGGMWIGFFLKLACVILSRWGGGSAEDLYAEAHEERRFMAEMQLYRHEQQAVLAVPGLQRGPGGLPGTPGYPSLQAGTPYSPPHGHGGAQPSYFGAVPHSQQAPYSRPASQWGAHAPAHHNHQPWSQGASPGPAQYSTQLYRQQPANAGVPFTGRASFTVGTYGGRTVVRRTSLPPSDWGSPWGPQAGGQSPHRTY